MSELQTCANYTHHLVMILATQSMENIYVFVMLRGDGLSLETAIHYKFFVSVAECTSNYSLKDINRFISIDT